MSKKLELIIFDLDGVLVDACEIHRISLNEALKEICDIEISEEDHYSKFNGLPTKTKLKILYNNKKISFNHIQQVSDLKQEKTLRVVSERCKVDNSKIEMLEWITLNGIHTACYTNSIRKSANLMLEKTGIREKFEMVVTNQDVKEPKPNPEGYIWLMEEFCVSPESTLIVEDSPNGIIAAEASRASVWKVKDPSEVNQKNIEEYINEDFDSYGW